MTQRKSVIKAVHLFHPEKNSKKSLKGQNDHDIHAHNECMKTSDHNYRSVVNCLSKYMMFAQASEMQSSVRGAFLHDSVVPPFFYPLARTAILQTDLFMSLAEHEYNKSP